MEEKEVMNGIIEVDGKLYISSEDYDNVWKLYGDLLDKAVRLQYWFEQQGIDVDELLDSLPTINEIKNINNHKKHD